MLVSRVVRWVKSNDNTGVRGELGSLLALRKLSATRTGPSRHRHRQTAAATMQQEPDLLYSALSVYVGKMIKLYNKYCEFCMQDDTTQGLREGLSFTCETCPALHHSPVSTQANERNTPGEI